MSVEWFFNHNLKPQGPVTLETLKVKIQRGEVGPQDLIMNSAEEDWKPARDFKIFSSTLFPALQLCDFSEAKISEKEWVLLRPKKEGGTPIQEGPFSIDELRQGVLKGLFAGEEFIWKPGLSGWCCLKDRPEMYHSI